MSLKLYQRGKVWHYRGTVAGRRLRGSCKTADKAIASRQVAEIESREWKCGFDGPQAVLTFAQAALMYRAAGKSGRFLAPVEDYFKDTLVKDIKPGTIKQMAMTLYGPEPLGDYTGAGCHQLCRRERAMPSYRVKRFETDTKVKEPADLRWVKAFMAEASLHLGAYALFMFLTGCRPGEALAVDRERDLNLQARTVIIRETKVRNERRAHLPIPLVAALANLPIIPGRPLFVYRNTDDLMQAWDRVIVRAGIQRLTPHCCRHGFATELLRAGIDVITVAWLGGWESPEHVLKTYGHALKKRDLTDVLIDTPLTQALAEVAKNASKSGGC